MHATPAQIEHMILDLLRQDHPELIKRADIIRRVSDRLHQNGAWEPADDVPSQSPNGHSLGEARIDWRITRLKGRGDIDNPRWGWWRLP